MYKLLLCTRYLRTRFIALASIISVMLGVATMVVVNSVMSGFSTQMRERINGILADVIIETINMNGEPDARGQMELARSVAGDHIDSMSASVEVWGLMHFRRAGQWIPRPVTLIGIEPDAEGRVTPLKGNLDSYQTVTIRGEARPPLRSAEESLSWELTAEALEHRRDWLGRQRRFLEAWEERADDALAEPLLPGEPVFDGSDASATEPPLASQKGTGGAIVQTSGENNGSVRQAANPFAAEDVPPELMTRPGEASAGTMDPDAPLPGRLYIGGALVTQLYQDPKTGKVFEDRVVNPGDDVKISTVSAGNPPEPRHFFATVADIYKSGMSEYDGTLVYCNLDYLQQMRGMMDPATGTGAVTTIKIRLKDYAHAEQVVSRLRNAFPPHLFDVKTWEDKQGPLLAAVDIESAILNVLLFMIIAVAGFGILAIFYMIVVEKTRDIGILKSLGASSRGIMAIFLSYGLGLGVVGSGVGVVTGLLFVRYINEIEKLLAAVTGRKVFDERIYYFPSIPTQVSPLMVVSVAFGAILIAVLASVLPARRASRLHPVQALRYE